MNIVPASTAQTRRGPTEWFTGAVWLQELTAAPAEARLKLFRVTFEPGARTAWHTHPHGQTLHILSGVGRVQKAGEPVREVHPGDTVWIAPGERHWHGAASNCAMVHLAAQIAGEDGNSATWFEQVSDQDFDGSGSAEPVNPGAGTQK